MDRVFAAGVDLVGERPVQLRGFWWTRSEFRTGLDALVTVLPAEYGVDAAADVVMERLGSLLSNAPQRALIDNGAWRTQ